MEGGKNMRNLIVATHGEMSQGIVQTLGVIVGEESVKDIEVYGLFVGENGNDIVEDIQKKVEASPQVDFVIMTDILGGSVDTGLLRLATYSNVWVNTGTNLIMLLDVLLSDPSASTHSVLEQAIDNAKAGILSRNKLSFTASLDDEDDF